MGVEVGIWRIDGGLSFLASVPMPSESQLEAVLEKDIGILGLDLMLIGRQVTTSFGQRIDLLGIDADGNLSVVELKTSAGRVVHASELRFRYRMRGSCHT